jgi:hypothetical protein
MGAMRVVFAIALGLLAAAGVVLSGLALSPASQRRWERWYAGWQAHRTAVALMHALERHDSAAIAAVSKSGAGHNFLCAQHIYPAEYWTAGVNGRVVAVGPDGEYLRFELRGQRLPGDTVAATMDIFIRPDDPAHVARFMMTTGTPGQRAALQACTEP